MWVLKTLGASGVRMLQIKPRQMDKHIAGPRKCEIRWGILQIISLTEQGSLHHASSSGQAMTLGEGYGMSRDSGFTVHMADLFWPHSIAGACCSLMIAQLSPCPSDCY